MRPMKAAFVTTDAVFRAPARHYIDEMARLDSHRHNRLFSSMAEARKWVSATPGP